MAERMARVDELIKQQLGEVILRELDLPLGCLVTITKVKTSKDLHHARVFVSILPKTNEREIFGMLVQQIRHLQHLLHQNITLHHSPKLQLAIDEGEKKAARIDELLEK